eukprot:3220432-Amphidinium_carterae.1
MPSLSKVAALVHTIVASIACGTAHVVCVDSSGKAYSWGASHYGQLGNSTPSRCQVPIINGCNFGLNRGNGESQGSSVDRCCLYNVISNKDLLIFCMTISDPEVLLSSTSLR